MERKISNITPEDMEVNATPERTVRAKSFDEKNYLNVKLKDGENSRELRIRILPIEETGTPFKEIHMHTVKVPVEVSPSGFKSYVCLNKTEEIDHEHFGNECPFCEMNHMAYEEMKKATSPAERERWKKISLENSSKPVCILRCIERGKEADGPKFWKFTIRADENDPMHIIKKLYKTRREESIEEAKMDNNGVVPEDFVPVNIMDLYEGRDLKVTITREVKDGVPGKKTSVSIVDYSKPRPLGTDEEIERWTTDTKKWSDVFVVKPYEYLDIIVKGEIPFYSKPKGKWVSKSSVVAENDIEEERRTEEDNEASEEIKRAERVAMSTCEESEEDDLPF